MGSAEAKLGELVDGKYELETLLGQGGMGAVYRARHAVTGRRVAIKWLLENDEARRRRFLREARAMGRLQHPNVVQIFDVSEHDGEIFLVMEHLEGESLREFMPETGLPPSEAIALLMPAFAGVAAAHQAGILHRDLKPENLFVCCDRDGTPYDTKVLDFGLAKAAEPEADSKLTNSGAIVGTPRYMSPEQLEEKHIDERTDIFALGLILYESLAGGLPYKSHSLNALLLEILTADHPPPHMLLDTIPEPLSMLVKKAIRRVPEDRFADVPEFARALEPYTNVKFQAPRQVHLASDDLGSGLTPLLDDERISSSIRTRPSSIDGAGRPSAAGTKDATPSAKRAHSEDAYAATAALASTEVAAATSSAQVAAPKRQGPLLTVAAVVVALAVGGVLALTVFGPDDTNDATPAPIGVAEPTPEPEPDPEPVAEVPEGVDHAEAEPVVEETPDPPVEEPVAVVTPEPAPAPERHARSRRRRAQSTETQTPPEEPTAPPAGAQGTDEGLRVNSRAGVLRADDF